CDTQCPNGTWASLGLYPYLSEGISSAAAMVFFAWRVSWLCNPSETGFCAHAHADRNNTAIVIFCINSPSRHKSRIDSKTSKLLRGQHLTSRQTEPSPVGERSELAGGHGQLRARGCKQSLLVAAGNAGCPPPPAAVLFSLDFRPVSR